MELHGEGGGALPLLPMYSLPAVYALISAFFRAEGLPQLAEQVMLSCPGPAPALGGLTQAQLSSHLSCMLSQLAFRPSVCAVPVHCHTSSAVLGMQAGVMQPQTLPLGYLASMSSAQQGAGQQTLMQRMSNAPLMLAQPQPFDTASMQPRASYAPGMPVLPTLQGPHAITYAGMMAAMGPTTATPYQPMSPLPELPAPSPELANQELQADASMDAPAAAGQEGTSATGGSHGDASQDNVAVPDAVVSGSLQDLHLPANAAAAYAMPQPGSSIAGGSYASRQGVAAAAHADAGYVTKGSLAATDAHRSMGGAMPKEGTARTVHSTMTIPNSSSHLGDVSLPGMLPCTQHMRPELQPTLSAHIQPGMVTSPLQDLLPASLLPDIASVPASMQGEEATAMIHSSLQASSKLQDVLQAKRALQEALPGMHFTPLPDGLDLALLASQATQLHTTSGADIQHPEIPSMGPSSMPSIMQLMHYESLGTTYEQPTAAPSNMLMQQPAAANQQPMATPTNQQQQQNQHIFNLLQQQQQQQQAQQQLLQQLGLEDMVAPQSQHSVMVTPVQQQQQASMSFLQQQEQQQQQCDIGAGMLNHHIAPSSAGTGNGYSMQVQQQHHQQHNTMAAAFNGDGQPHSVQAPSHHVSIRRESSILTTTSRHTHSGGAGALSCGGGVMGDVSMSGVAGHAVGQTTPCTSAQNNYMSNGGFGSVQHRPVSPTPSSVKVSLAGGVQLLQTAFSASKGQALPPLLSAVADQHVQVSYHQDMQQQHQQQHAQVVQGTEHAGLAQEHELPPRLDQLVGPDIQQEDQAVAQGGHDVLHALRGQIPELTDTPLNLDPSSLMSPQPASPQPPPADEGETILDLINSTDDEADEHEQHDDEQLEEELQAAALADQQQANGQQSSPPAHHQSAHATGSEQHEAGRPVPLHLQPLQQDAGNMAQAAGSPREFLASGLLTPGLDYGSSSLDDADDVEPDADELDSAAAASAPQPEEIRDGQGQQGPEELKADSASTAQARSAGRRSPEQQRRRPSQPEAGSDRDTSRDRAPSSRSYPARDGSRSRSRSHSPRRSRFRETPPVDGKDDDLKWHDRQGGRKGQQAQQSWHRVQPRGGAANWQQSNSRSGSPALQQAGAYAGDRDKERERRQSLPADSKHLGSSKRQMSPEPARRNSRDDARAHAGNDELRPSSPWRYRKWPDNVETKWQQEHKQHQQQHGRQQGRPAAGKERGPLARARENGHGSSSHVASYDSGGSAATSPQGDAAPSRKGSRQVQPASMNGRNHARDDARTMDGSKYRSAGHEGNSHASTGRGQSQPDSSKQRRLSGDEDVFDGSKRASRSQGDRWRRDGVTDPNVNNLRGDSSGGPDQQGARSIQRGSKLGHSGTSHAAAEHRGQPHANGQASSYDHRSQQQCDRATPAARSSTAMHRDSDGRPPKQVADVGSGNGNNKHGSDHSDIARRVRSETPPHANSAMHRSGLQRGAQEQGQQAGSSRPPICLSHRKAVPGIRSRDEDNNWQTPRDGRAKEPPVQHAPDSRPTTSTLGKDQRHYRREAGGVGDDRVDRYEESCKRARLSS